ncbi:hypothetical protein ABMA27_005673 [Loxostege sticticalis]|uniref:Uncharacterized protein n=1 Tax=Loxostege sticticalis TaxID=481309 RepID=A0ABR3HK12_LOXSC
MGNYEIVDIAYTGEREKEPEPSYIFDEVIEEENQKSFRWPSFVEFNKREQDQIKTFFKATPKKAKAKGRGDKSPILEEKKSVESKQDKQIIEITSDHSAKAQTTAPSKESDKSPILEEKKSVESKQDKQITEITSNHSAKAQATAPSKESDKSPILDEKQSVESKQDKQIIETTSDHTVPSQTTASPNETAESQASNSGKGENKLKTE